MPFAREILTLAREHRLSTYDGAYLWLARDRRLALATGDKGLVRAAGALSIPVLGG